MNPDLQPKIGAPIPTGTLEMPDEFTVRVGDASLAGTRVGHGTPVLFLHAGVADRRMWQAQMAMAAANHTAVAYDRRGFGKTVAGTGRYDHVGDLRALMDDLGLTSAVLVGCSQGGRIAIDLALTEPDRVGALLLVAPAVSGAPDPGPQPGPIASLNDRLDQAEAEGDIDRVNAIEAHMWLDGPLSPEGRVKGPIRDLFLEMNGIANQFAFANQATDLRQEPPSAWDRLAVLATPTLVLWGDLDFPDIQFRCQEIASAIPGARSAVIADTAHLPSLERPEIFNHYLREFLDDLNT